jgi:hypothetical protein
MCSYLAIIRQVRANAKTATKQDSQQLGLSILQNLNVESLRPVRQVSGSGVKSNNTTFKTLDVGKLDLILPTFRGGLN